MRPPRPPRSPGLLLALTFALGLWAGREAMGTAPASAPGGFAALLRILTPILGAATALAALGLSWSLRHRGPSRAAGGRAGAWGLFLFGLGLLRAGLSPPAEPSLAAASEEAASRPVVLEGIVSEPPIVSTSSGGRWQPPGDPTRTPEASAPSAGGPGGGSGEAGQLSSDRARASADPAPAPGPPAQPPAEPAMAAGELTRLTLCLAGTGRLVEVVCAGDARHARGGALLRATGLLRPPRGPRNPGDPPGRGAWTLRVAVPDAIVVTGRSLTGAALLGRLRQGIQDQLRRSLPAPARELVTAMLLGDRRGISAELTATLRATGTYHLLAVSGLHVGVFLWIVLRIPLPVAPGVVVRLLFLAFLATLTGGDPPVLRAGIMYALHALLGLCGRRPTILGSTGWASILLLAFEPALLLDVGFQLSFGAMLAIGIWSGRLALGGIGLGHTVGLGHSGLRPPGPGRAGLATHVQRLLRLLLEPFVLSFVLFAATAPLLALHFGRVTPWAPLWNVLSYPLALACVGGGLVILGVGAATAWGAHLLGGLLALPIEGILALLELGSRAPAAIVPLPPCDRWVVPFAAVAVLAAALGARPRSALRTGALLGIVALAAALLQLRGRDRGPELWTLDAGPGDASVLQVPEVGAVLIDAGLPGSLESSSRRLERALEALDARPARLVVLTHPHEDHFRALCQDLGAVGPTSVVAPPVFLTRRSGRTLGRALTEEGFSWRTVRVAERWLLGGAPPLQLEAFLATGADLPEPLPLNDASLSVRIEREGKAILLLGDLEEAGLAALFASGRDLRTQVLLVPHHGRRSALLPELLRRARPEQVLVSGDGRGGARALVRELEDAGIATLATWRVGAIRTFWEVGRGWVSEAWSGGPAGRSPGRP